LGIKVSFQRPPHGRHITAGCIAPPAVGARAAAGVSGMGCKHENNSAGTTAKRK
jgi:hypothetical protein